MDIPYPKRPSEAEIQAELWNLLTMAGIDARLEVKAPSARFDIVVFRERQARGIIECKSWSQSYLRNQKWQRQKNSKQLTKYREGFGVPVFVCGCRASIDPAVRFAAKCAKL